MDQLPETKSALVLRTDFSDTAKWKLICAAINKSVGEFKAYVEFLSNPEYTDISIEQLLALVAKNSKHIIIFVVDQVTTSRVDYPILVVDVHSRPGRTFRVIPSEMWGVENNLSISNMDFHEFADSVDEDGVFRGFSQS